MFSIVSTCFRAVILFLYFCCPIGDPYQITLRLNTVSVLLQSMCTYLSLILGRKRLSRPHRLDSVASCDADDNMNCAVFDYFSID